MRQALTWILVCTVFLVIGFVGGVVVTRNATGSPVSPVVAVGQPDLPLCPTTAVLQVQSALKLDTVVPTSTPISTKTHKDDPKTTNTPVPTVVPTDSPTNIPEPTQIVPTPVPTDVVPDPTRVHKQCDNGEGNGGTGCSPSQNGNNDENNTTPKQDHNKNK